MSAVGSEGVAGDAGFGETSSLASRVGETTEIRGTYGFGEAAVERGTYGVGDERNELVE